MFETLVLGSLAGFLVAFAVLILSAIAQGDLGRFEVTRHDERDDVIEIESTGICPHCGTDLT